MAAGGPGSVPAAKYKTYNSFYRSPYRLFVCMFHVLTHLTMQHQLCGFSAWRQACRQWQRQYRQNLGRVDWRMPFDTQRPLWNMSFFKFICQQHDSKKIPVWLHTSTDTKCKIFVFFLVPACFMSWLISQVESQHSINSVSFSSDGKLVASGSDENLGRVNWRMPFEAQRTWIYDPLPLSVTRYSVTHCFDDVNAVPAYWDKISHWLGLKSQCNGPSNFGPVKKITCQNLWPRINSN